MSFTLEDYILVYEFAEIIARSSKRGAPEMRCAAITIMALCKREMMDEVIFEGTEDYAQELEDESNFLLEVGSNLLLEVGI